jgi:hypothetical protein
MPDCVSTSDAGSSALEQPVHVGTARYQL